MRELVIPEAVVTDLQAGVGRVIGEVANSATRPDAVVVLQRSGSLAYEAVEGYAETHGIELPARIDIYLGKMLAERAPMERFPSLHEGFFSDDPRFETEYQNYVDYSEWIVNEREGQGIIQELRAGLPGWPDRANPRILIVDDTAVTGVTLNVAAKALVKAAYGPGAQVNTMILFDYHGEWGGGGRMPAGEMVNGEWVEKGSYEIPGIIDSNWPQLSDMFYEIGDSDERGRFYRACGRFMPALVLGFDYGYTDTDELILVALDSAEEIAALAAACAETFGCPDFLPSFCRTFGLEADQLVGIHRQVARQLRAIGAKTTIKLL